MLMWNLEIKAVSRESVSIKKIISVAYNIHKTSRKGSKGLLKNNFRFL